MKISFVTALIALSVGSSAFACPWGGSVYKVRGNNAAMLFQPNATCSGVVISRVTTPNDGQRVKMNDKGDYWSVSLGNGYEMTFSKNGRTVMWRTGGRATRMSFHKMKLK